MSNAQAPTIRPSAYCTTDCGRPAVNADPIAFYRNGVAMTLICRHLMGV